MSEWITPKTDWKGYVDGNGEYIGDRFNASDYNRIKNNLDVLSTLALKIYDHIYPVSMGPDKKPGDYFFADEINIMEKNLETINKKTLNYDVGETKEYYDNDKTMDFRELNRLEKATLDLYNSLYNQLEGRRMFTWNFGIRGNL